MREILSLKVGLEVVIMLVERAMMTRVTWMSLLIEIGIARESLKLTEIRSKALRLTWEILRAAFSPMILFIELVV